jgi:hypothetical protein
MDDGHYSIAEEQIADLKKVVVKMREALEVSAEVVRCAAVGEPFHSKVAAFATLVQIRRAVRASYGLKES